MKTILLFAAAFTALFCSFVTLNHSTGASPDLSNPSTILLVDKYNSTTIRCVKKGNAWTVSDSVEAIRYLLYIARHTFNNDGVSNFHDLQVDFDSSYQKGALTGMGTKNGANVPIGVAYTFTSSSRWGKKISMGNPVSNTCTGAPCGCCTFRREKGSILGCGCFVWESCPGERIEGLKMCNHSISTTEGN